MSLLPIRPEPSAFSNEPSDPTAGARQRGTAAHDARHRDVQQGRPVVRRLASAAALAAAVGMALAGCDSQKVQVIDTASLATKLGSADYVIMDTRDDSLYNGFHDQGAPRGGHIRGAGQFTTAWLDYIAPEKFEEFAAGKGITKDRTVVFYDSNPDNLERVSAEFASRGYKVAVYKDYLAWANDPARPMDAFPNYPLSVSPQWLDRLMKGGKPESYDNDQYMLFEVSWGPREKSNAYMQHIVGAYHFDTDWIENAPVWNLSDPKVIEQNLLQNGITHDKTIVLYSDNQLAALRVLWALKWAGVKDVRFLNGGLRGWVDAGLPTETKVNTPEPAEHFGVTIPANPQINISMPAQVLAAQKAGLKLISSRSWDEYIGKVSGYDYIPGKGEPKGAIWDFAGTDSSNMADYYDPDNTLRNPNEIFALWKGQNIHAGDKLAFYCGTGWRAGVPWFMTQLAGWKDTFIYDGGWNAWQMDSVYPVQKGAPGDMSKPDAHNDFGKVHKQGASCKS